MLKQIKSMFSGLKKSKLARRIILSMLLASLGMGTIVFGVSMAANYLQETSAAKLQTELAELSANESSKALLSQAKESFSSMVQEEADSKNQFFGKMRSELKMLTALLEKTSTADAAEGMIPPVFSETENGVKMGRSIVAGTDAPSEEQRSQQRWFSRIENTLASLFENEQMLRNVVIGTKTGVFYRYSDYNDFEEGYDPRKRDWYKRAMATPGMVVWSNAYVETYGHLVVKCSKTFLGADGKIAGVMALDISIQSMVDSLLASDSQNYFSFLLDSSGKFVARQDGIPETFIAAPADGGEESSYAVVKRMMGRENGISEVQLEGKPYYAAFAPVNETGWSYCIAYSQEAMTQSVREIGAQISMISMAENDKMKKDMDDLRIRFVLIVFACTMVVQILAVALSKKILHPISTLSEGIREMGKGNLQVKLDVEGDDEIAELGHAFNKMSDDLQAHIRELNAITAEKQRISTELSLATQIQANMLPSVFPAFPDRTEFDIYASMDPAKEVGGDFYDFFMIDNDHLGMLIADVSGKGVPAALFMMISKTILKTQAQHGGTPAEILYSVNNSLCENNKAEMFVTCWFAIYEISTGKLTAANAGHEFPALRRAGGKYELFKDKHGFVLAGMEEAHYRQYEIQLQPGDSLFVYTDGVAEATNANQELFGTERMLEALNLNPGAGVEETLHIVRGEVDRFVGEAEQFDDLTMLAFRRKQ